MTTLPQTGATELTSGQATPESAVNEAFRYLDAGFARSVIEDRDLTAPPGTCADGARYLVAASPTGLWAGQAGKLAIAVGTNAANGWLFVTIAREGFKLYIKDEDGEILYNGSAWVSAVGGFRTIAGFFTSTPTSSEVLLIYVAIDPFTLPANLSGSQAAKLSSGGVNPAATFAIDIKQNGTSIATISISTGGVVTLTTTSGTSKSVVAGDIISFHAPSTPDASIANWGFNLKGLI